MTLLRKIWARYLGLLPLWQGLIVNATLLTIWVVVVLTTDLVDTVVPLDGWPGTAGGIVFGAVAGWVFARVGRYVTEVAQARRDLAADADAMRGAIERLERGDR